MEPLCVLLQYEMSETEVFENIEYWTAEECQQNMAETLPKLFESLKNEENAVVTERVVVIIRLILHQFSPLIPLFDFENKVFNKISFQLERIFESTYDFIKQQLMHNLLHTSETIMQYIQLLCTISDCLKEFLDKLLIFEEVNVNDISHLSQTIFHIIHGTYQHCKNSEVIYKQYLENLNDPLTLLFQKTGLLLLSMVHILNKSVVKCTSDVEALKRVLNGVKEVGEVAFDIDVKVMASVWKLYAKFACENSEMLEGKLEINSAIIILTSQMLNWLESMKEIVQSNEKLECSEEKTVRKFLRTSGFNMKIIVLLCEKYNYLLNCHEELFRMILFLYTHSPPSLHAITLPDSLRNEMLQYLTIGIDPLLRHIMNHRQLINMLIVKRNEFVTRESAFSLLLVLLAILEKLPNADSQDFGIWMAHSDESYSTSILSLIFSCLPHCHAELMLPVYLFGLSCRGKLQRNSSLYEYVCIHLCGFVACLPARHFVTCEKVLLQNLLNHNFWCRQMSADVWAFVGRYSTSTLCYHHCCILAKICDKCSLKSASIFVQLRCLLIRLVTVLAEDDAKKFLRCYSDVFMNCCLWKQYPSNLHLAIEATADHTHSTLQSFCKNQETSIKIKNQLSKSLHTLCVAQFNLANSNEISFGLKNVRDLKHTAILLWRSSNGVSKISVLPGYGPIVELIVALTALLIPKFGNEDLRTVLNLLSRLILTKSEAVRLQIVNFLNNLRNANITHECSALFDLISSLFAVALQDPHWLIFDAALQAFARFARETNHDTIISSILCRNPHLQGVVTNYLNKVPYQGNIDPASDIIALLRKEEGKMFGKPQFVDSPKVIEETSGHLECKSEDSLGKDGLQTEETKLLEDLLCNLETNVCQLKQLSMRSSFPKWGKERIVNIQRQLESL